jgi:DNA polymerase III subunit delta'
MKFAEVIGQEAAKERLMQIVDGGRMPHAIMLCGPSGSGKMALALALASYLLCKGRDKGHDSCGECNQCKMIAKWEHPDLHFTFPTIKRPSMSSDHKPVSDDFIKEWRGMLSKGPYFSMQQWMEEIGAENQQAIITAGESDELIRKLSLKSSQGGYKVSVIWLPERMNIECANKLLKLIEEPPTQTVFIMVCEEPAKLLETIRSRTQRIDIKRIDTESIGQALVTRRGISDDAATRIARIANGSWLKALEALDADNENNMFLEMFKSLMRLAYTRKVKELKHWSEEMQKLGRERQKRFLDYFMRLIRENFMYNFRRPELNYMTQGEEDFSQKFARFINEDNVIPISELANKAMRDIGQNANGKIVFFDFAIQMIVLLIPKNRT